MQLTNFVDYIVVYEKLTKTDKMCDIIPITERSKEMKSISSSIADTLETQGIIQKEDVDKCRYGLDILLSSVLEIISILVISAFVGNLVQTLLFFIAFVPLRIYAGGYHANTKLKCYLVSLGVYVVFTVIVMSMPYETCLIINLLSTMFSLFVVFIAAPMVNRNKNVNNIERFYCSVNRGKFRFSFK